MRPVSSFVQPRSSMSLSSKDNFTLKSPITDEKKAPTSLSLDGFVSALAEVGRVVFSLEQASGTSDLDILQNLIENYLLSLDACIQSSERGINHNA